MGKYTVKDLVYYAGLFAGIIVTFKALEPFAIHSIIRLIAGLVVGVGLGWIAERVYSATQLPKG